MESPNKKDRISSKLYREISPPRGPQLSTQTALPDLFKKPGSLAILRPGFNGSPIHEEEEAIRAPRLLARLEQLLSEKLELVNKVGAASKGFAGTQMRTDAHRQVFDAFLHSFTTYRTLLMRIKHEYDGALDDSLAAVYDNVHMKAELASSEEMMDMCLAEAKAKALDDATLMRQELQDQHSQAEHVTVESEKRCQEADSEIQRRRAHITALKKEASKLMAMNKRIKYEMLKSSSFASSTLLSMYDVEIN